MSDDNRRPGRVPVCKQHLEAEVRRKKTPMGDVAVCSEGGHILGWYCMAEMNEQQCQYLRHTTATHQTLTGQTWVDMAQEGAEVQVAMGEDEVETEIVDAEYD